MYKIMDENNVYKNDDIDLNDVEQIINHLNNSNIKRIKKDRGLIERAESCKTILTEDNRQLLND